MPDKRKHRGAHPKDVDLFAGTRLDGLRSAVGDLSWLLTKGYAAPSSQAIVGDRYGLTRRQRMAAARAACADQALAGRLARRVDTAALAGRDLAIDGYNLLITVESALAGAIILCGRDTTYRDLASIHGSYRTMAETLPALELIGEVLASLNVGEVLWYLDSPVSNSGRLRARMLHLAADHRWPWRVELEYSPDALLIASDRVVVTSDSVILDRCAAWTNLARHIIDAHIPDPWIILR